MIREAAVNLDAYDPYRILTKKPDLYRFCDLAVTTRNGEQITAGDREKYAKTAETIILKGKRHARYLNMGYARESDVHEVYPDNMLPAAALSDDYFIPGDLGRERIRPGVNVRLYDLSDERKRTRLADTFIAEFHRYPLSDFNLDGCWVPELVFSRLPWKFKDTCDFLSKLRQRLPARPDPGDTGGCELGINLSGALVDLSIRQIGMLIDCGLSYVIFEQVSPKEFGDNQLWKCSMNACRFLQSGVLPIFCTTKDREVELCRKVCEATGAAMAV